MSVTQNDLSVRARRAGGNLCNLAEQEKVAENVKRGWRLRHCDDALSTSSSLIACTVRFASRSPWKRAEKPIDSLFGETPLKENSFKNSFLRSFLPFLCYPTLNLSRVFSPRGEALSTSGAFLAAKRKCEKKREEKGEEREAESVAVSLKKVYFANKTGLLLCAVLIETIKNHPHTGGVREPFKMAPLPGHAKRIY